MSQTICLYNEAHVLVERQGEYVHMLGEYDGKIYRVGHDIASAKIYFDKRAALLAKEHMKINHNITCEVYSLQCELKPIK